MIKNAIVVGAGIGGLACAIALARRGVVVTLLEQASKIAEVGAGLQISPNGLVVLRALGVETAILHSGAITAQAVVLADYKQGRQVARLDLKKMKNQRYLFVHRHSLIKVLELAARQANVKIELGKKVVSVSPGEFPQVAFEDGSSARAEVIICADGVHSIGRQVVSPGPSASFSGQVAWRATVPVQEPEPVARVTMSPGRHLVCYPINDGRLMNIVAVQERDEWASDGWNHSDDPDNLRSAFADFGGPVQELLQQVRDVNLWGLFRYPVVETWSAGNVALIGDAAHPTLPFLAQGANLALEDAWVLADCLMTKKSIDAYEPARKPRVTRVVAAASKNAWKYHLPEGPMRSLAHLGLAIGSKIAPKPMMQQFDWIYGHDVTQL